MIRVWNRIHGFKIFRLTYVFEGLLKLRERRQAGLDDAVGPLAHLGVRVPVAADGRLDRLLDDVRHFVHHELRLQSNE
jgi:hypothetical protein